MSKEINNKKPKKRDSTYEPKVKFDGTFEQMIAISTTGAGVKKKDIKKK
jgi:hypothetical protein